MKRVIKLCVIFIIISVTLSTCLITSFAFSNQYPAYLGSFGEAAYIEIDSSTFGRCSLVFPISYQENYLSFTGNRFVNITSGTIYGYLVTQSGNVYDIRGQRLSNLQYATSSGYQTIYNDITYNEIYNTNVHFSNTSSDNEFVRVNSYQIIVIVLLLFLCLAETFNGFMSFIKRGRYV